MTSLYDRYNKYWGEYAVSGPLDEVEVVPEPSMPDAPLAMILALVKDTIAVAVAFGCHLTMQQQVALLALAGSTTAVLGFWDASLRKHRNQRVAAEAPQVLIHHSSEGDE